MMNTLLAHGDTMCNKYGLKVARVFMALLFLASAYGKITNFDGTVAFMQGAGMPFATVLLVIAIIIDIVAPVLLILGKQVRHAARALILYVIIATVYFHMDFSDHMQMTAFLKNLALIGGLLAVAAAAPGRDGKTCGPDCDHK